MLTGTLRNKIDSIWTTLWNEGSTNPLTNIEQMTYLIFMRSLDEKEMMKEQDANLLGIEYESLFPKDKPEYRWHISKNIGKAEELYQLMQQEIFPFIKTLDGTDDNSSFARYMRDAIFQISKPGTLQKVIAAIDELPLDDKDMNGDIYEYLLSKLQQSGTNSQFRTPAHIREMMVQLVQPTSDDIICDPAMGSRVIIMITADSNEGDRLSSPLLENKNMDWCAF